MAALLTISEPNTRESSGNFLLSGSPPEGICLRASNSELERPLETSSPNLFILQMRKLRPRERLSNMLKSLWHGQIRRRSLLRSMGPQPQL